LSIFLITDIRIGKDIIIRV